MGSSPIGATIRRHNILIIYVNDVLQLLMYVITISE